VVAYGTSNGVLIPDGGLGVGWKSISAGLPKVIIMDMVYDETDDLLVLSTMGRGVWYLEYASFAAQGIPPPTGLVPRFTQEGPRTDGGRSIGLDFSSLPPVNQSDLLPPDDYYIVLDP
jgi:hypothetical protein